MSARRVHDVHVRELGPARWSHRVRFLQRYAGADRRTTDRIGALR